jgi:peptidoglycan/xylan/chitin deacetylase (PgdA/CDA1 family)
MEKTNFFISWSIDCEATQHSVRDPELGERGSAGFADVLEEFQLKATFFVTPGDIESRPALYRNLGDRGFEIGLHLHPADVGFAEFMGVMGPEEQRRAIVIARQRWSQAMGTVPRAFCMGYGSANDFTYGILEEAGFTHGQISIPGRRLPECACVWEGAPLYVHYANRYNRLLTGDMDFVEVPHTIDLTSYMWGGRHPQDYRVELVDAKNHWYTAHKSVMAQIGNSKVPIKIIRGVTHNTFDYSDPLNFRRETLRDMIAGLSAILQESECVPVPATVGDIAAEYRRQVAKPDPIHQYQLDRRGYAKTPESHTTSRKGAS